MINVPLLWLWRARYWVWIVSMASASPIPPLATALFFGLASHIMYDMTKGSLPPRALLPDGRNRQALLEARNDQGEFVEPYRRQATATSDRIALIDAGERQGAARISRPRTSMRVADLGTFDNVWVVGAKGSGKTTVLRAIVASRHGARVALDPHNHPGKWPCQVVGGGRRYPAIREELAVHVDLMSRRYEAMESGALTEADCREHPHTIVGDEWMSIAEALPGRPAARDQEAEPGASTRLFEILTEGRKAGVWVLAASHADTATAMGLLGKKAVLLCFDRVVYLGAMAVERHPAAADMERPAVVLDPERNTYQLLDTSDAPALAASSHRSADADTREPPRRASAPAVDDLPPLDLADLLADISDYGPPVAPTLRPLSEDEQQRLVLARRLSPKLGKTQAIKAAFNNPSGPNYQRFAADPSWRQG